MKRAPLVLVAALLAGCPGPPPPVTRSAPASRPTPPPTGNKQPPKVPVGSPLPGFEDVKLGEVYVYEMLAGAQRRDEVSARSDDELVVTSAIGLEGTTTKAETKFPLKATAEQPAVPLAPGDKIGEETLEVSGRTY